MGAPHGNVPGISGTRFPSHQLSNGLYVSGYPDQQRERGSTIGVPQMPYTGGDVKKSGELGKMFDIPVESILAAKLKKSGSFTSPAKPSSSGASSSHSGPLLSNGAPVSSPRQNSNSGPLTRCASNDSLTTVNLKNAQTKVAKGLGSLPSGLTSTSKVSGPISPTLPATGLITSGPISAGPICTTGATRKNQSGPMDGFSASSGGIGPGINHLIHEHEYSFRKNFPKAVFWTVIPLFIMGFIAGGFIIAVVHNFVLLTVVGALFMVVVLVFAWNTCWGSRSVTGFLAKFPDSELSAAKDGQYVKVTGVVTCGSVPLESSYQKVTRCMYTSTGLYEYRSLLSKSVGEKHHRFTWGLRHLERHVVDFYISDFHTGLRALVKAGCGARVTSYVDETTVLDVTPEMKDLPSDFLRWLTERNLSSDERIMRLKEGYIKEGSTVTVLGVVQRHENILMIVPPSEGISTGCQWKRLLLPANLEGIILACDRSTRNEGIPL